MKTLGEKIYVNCNGNIGEYTIAGVRYIPIQINADDQDGTGVAIAEEMGVTLGVPDYDSSKVQYLLKEAQRHDYWVDESCVFDSKDEMLASI
jgi:hypothetical protein